MNTMHKLTIVVIKHKTTNISADLYLTKKLLDICYLFNDSHPSPPTPVQRDEGDVSTSPNLAHTKLQKIIVNPKM